MSFSIRDFNAILSRHNGIDRVSHYEVIISPPSALIRHSISADLKYFCETATLPGVGIQTGEVRPTGYGVIEKRPTGIIFEDLSLMFLNDGNNSALDFFHRWENTINNFNKDSDIKSKDYFEYPNEYQTSIEIKKFSSDGKEKFRWNIFEAYPLNVSSIQAGWGENDTATKFNVTFAYQTWSSKKV